MGCICAASAVAALVAPGQDHRAGRSESRLVLTLDHEDRGPLNGATVFAIDSITKTCTSLLLMDMVTIGAMNGLLAQVDAIAVQKRGT
jgi:CubicO group peptidase (beta-lactamase class C family)